MYPVFLAVRIVDEIYTATIFGLINCRTQLICCVRQLIKPNIVYKDTTGMTNHMILQQCAATHICDSCGSDCNPHSNSFVKLFSEIKFLNFSVFFFF